MASVALDAVVFLVILLRSTGWGVGGVDLCRLAVVLLVEDGADLLLSVTGGDFDGDDEVRRADEGMTY